MAAAGDPRTIAREVLDANRYLVLATADAAGVPWASPVWFATEDLAEFVWASSPEAQHSRNLGARPEVALVVFDSRAAIGTGQAVYMRAVAGEVPEDDVDRALGVFSRRSVADGGQPWERARVVAPARHRLYRAVARTHWILDPAEGGVDRRIEVAGVPRARG